MAVRVFQLARDLGLSSEEIIDRLKQLGVGVQTAASSIDEDTADKVKRIVKIDALAARRKRRFYGSEEDDAQREAEARVLAERIAAERATREKAAARAREAAEARKSGRKRPTKTEGPLEAQGGEEAPALVHRPGAPRLAPKVAADAGTQPKAQPRVAPPSVVPSASRAPKRDIRTLQELRRLRPGDPAVRAELALRYLEKGHSTRAREHIKEAALLAPHLKQQWGSLLEDLDPEGLEEMITRL